MNKKFNKAFIFSFILLFCVPVGAKSFNYDKISENDNIKQEIVKQDTGTRNAASILKYRDNNYLFLDGENDKGQLGFDVPNNDILVPKNLEFFNDKNILDIYIGNNVLNSNASQAISSFFVAKTKEADKECIYT